MNATRGCWLFGALSLMLSCATTPPLPALPSGHPASPQAAEAPLPERNLLPDAPFPDEQAHGGRQ
jgi:hypothetical protein